MNYKLRQLVAATLAGTALLGFGANAFADTTDDIVNALIAKGVLTEEEGALLLNARELEKTTKAKTPVAKQKDGLVLESPDGNFSFTPTGRVHTDYRIFDYDDSASNVISGTVSVPAAVAFNGSNAAAVAANTAAIAAANATNNAIIGNSIPNAASNIGANTFDIRRARIGFKTKYKEFYEAELNADISVGANTSVTSTNWDVAYFNVAWWKPVQFRFGLFKMPMNLEEVTSSNNIDFMERSYVNALAPQKEIGAMIHGVPFTGTTYALAVSNGSGAKQAETDIREDGKDVIGRVTANFAELMTVPDKEAIYHVGASFSTGDQPQGNIGVSGRTESRGATFFRAPVLANGAPKGFQSIDRSRIGLEGAVAIRQFKLQGEWLQQNNEFDTNTRGYSLDTTAWYAEALWAITGEKYADGYKNGVMGGIKPLKDFDPATFSGGAWEAGLRYNEFDASDYNTVGIEQGVTLGAADAAISTKAAGFAKAKSYTAGVKFLPNSNMRFMLNYVKTDFSDVIGGTTGGIILNNKRVDEEQALLMRAQWMF
jgi:phosphate-selective porin OprO and OprP